MKGTDYVVVSHVEEPETMGVIVDHQVNLVPQIAEAGSPTKFHQEPMVAVAWFDKPTPCPSYHTPEELSFEGMHNDLSQFSGESEEETTDDDDDGGDDPGGEPVTVEAEVVEDVPSIAAAPAPQAAV